MAGEILTTDVSEDRTNIRLTALWADFAAALAVGDINSKTAEEVYVSYAEQSICGIQCQMCLHTF